MDQASLIQELGHALGLFSADGSFETAWLSEPAQRLKSILVDASRRAALGRFLDEVIPGPAGDREGWHPLLFTEAGTAPGFGNLYCVFDEQSRPGQTELALAGEFHTAAGSAFALHIGVRVPLLRVVGNELSAALGDDTGALEVYLTLQPPASTAQVQFDELRARLRITLGAVPAFAPAVDLVGLRVGSAAPRTFTLDGEDFGGDVITLVTGLVSEALENAPEPFRSHLLPVFGVDPALPQLPWAELVRDPDALRRWLVTLVDSNRLGTWFAHVRALLGVPAPTGPAASGTWEDPFSIAVLSGNIRLALTLAVSDGRLYPGLALRIGAGNSVHLAADVIVLGLSLAGSAAPEVLPEASLSVRSPTPLLAPVLAGDGTTVTAAAGGARAGLSFTNGALRPLLELTGVVIAGHAHPRIDLTNLDAVGDLAAEAVEALLVAALGSHAPGRSLLALIGAAAPTHAVLSGDVWSGSGRPRLDVVRFLSDPLGALAAFQRDALAANAWGALLGELAALIGLETIGATSIQGDGTPTLPWAYTLASAGPLAVRILAWGRATDTLHLGGEIALSEGAFSLRLRSEVVKLSLPAAGGPELLILHEHRAALQISPLPVARIEGWARIGAQRLAAEVDWLLGSPPVPAVRLEQVAIELDGTALPQFDLTYPFPAATPIDDAVVRALAALAAAQAAGALGSLIAPLIGLAPGQILPADFPTLSGDLRADFVGKLRPFADAVANGAAAESGTPHLRAWLQLLSALCSGQVSDIALAPAVRGSGTHDDPLRAALDSERRLELLVAWDGGPPLQLLAAVLANAADSDSALAQAVLLLRAHDPVLAAALDELDDVRLERGVAQLQAFFSASDSVVPLASQVPQGVSEAARVVATHSSVLELGAAEIRAAIGGAPALLLSAPFADHNAWASVIGSDAHAHIDLRQDTVPSERVDLRTLQGVVPFYTADLSGSDVAGMTAQITRVLDRLAELRPGQAFVLVAHSLTGRAAVAAAQPGRVSKVVTVATPHLGALPPYLHELAAGVALNVALALRSQLVSGPLTAAIDEAAAVVSSAPAPNSSGVIPTAAMVEPVEAPTPSAVPVTAIAAVALPAGAQTLRAALAAALQAAAPSGSSESSKLSLGVGLRLDTAADTGALAVHTQLRLDLGEIGLESAVSDRALRGLSVVANIERSDGWLLGGAGLRPDGTAWPARARAASIALHWDVAAGLTTSVSLRQAGVLAVPRNLSASDAEFPAVMDAIFAVLDAEAADSPSVAQLLAALRALGLLVPDAARLAVDAFAALQADGAAFLAPRLRAALEARFLEHDPSTGLDLGSFRVAIDPASAVVHVTGGLSAAGSMRASVELDIAVTTLALSGSCELSIAGATLAWRDGVVSVAVPPWLRATQLYPVAAPAGDFVPRLVLSTASSALLRAVFPARPNFSVIERLLVAGEDLADGGLRDLGRIGDTLGLVLRQLGVALGLPPADGLALPPGLLLNAAADSGGRAVLSLATSAPIGGVLDVDLGLGFGPGLAVQPQAAVRVQVPNPAADAGASAWRDVAIELSFSDNVGLALEVGAVRVELLPAFSGWNSLLAGGVALLPRALDEITGRIPASSIKQAVLDVASAFNLFGPNWSSHSDDFQALLDWNFDASARGQILTAVANLWTSLGLPGNTSHSGSTLSWTAPALPAPVSGPINLHIDWANALPALAADAVLTVVVAGGTSALDRVALRLGLDAALAADAHLVAGIGLEHPLATNVSPRIELGVVPGPAALLRILPLGTIDDAGPLNIELLPTALATFDEEALPGSLGFDVLLPLLAALLQRLTGSTALWPGGPSVVALVNASGLFAPDHRLVDPAPSLPTVLGNIAAALSASFTLGQLELVLGRIAGGDRIGVTLGGYIPVPIDSVELRLLFGQSGAAAEDKTEFRLFQRSGTEFVLAPELSANHFGVGVRGVEGHPLVSNEHMRLGGGDAYAFFDLGVDVASAVLNAEFRGAGVALDELGISLGGAQGGQNPIASGILGSAQSGDAAPAQPTFGIAIEYVLEPPGHEAHGGGWILRARLGDADQRQLWIGLHAGFGPLYIDQVGVELQALENPTWIKLLVDGGVDVAGFAAQVDDLSLQIPLANIGDQTLWAVDLAGLGVAYSGGGISLRGGLVKHTLTGELSGVEYSGLLQLRLQSLGAVAVGAWSKLHDSEGDLDSLFVFAAVFVTIPFPPYFELQALGGGFGYNRALVVPDDMNRIPSFALVQVLDDPGAVDRPLALLDQLRSQLPARRGSLWFAAGIRGALFTVVDVIAVVYVALDRGVEVGIVGLGRVEQPKGSPIIVIELALKVRFSSAEGVLSIQAQLTDRSWLLMPECQLTGGFALFIWFPRGKFVFTVGGYHPAFLPEPEFPIVPRLGFRCNLLGVIQIKGESYFALTNSCVMAGARFEAAYDIGWLRAWFRAWVDFLLAWDPFHYDAAIGVELGADFNIEIDLLFGTIRVHFSISVGADVHVVGPPLHGEVHAHLGPISLTVPFGDHETDKPPRLTWEEFRDRYVLADSADTVPVSVQPEEGLAALARGATPPDGKTAANAWRFEAEWSVLSTTSLPGSHAASPLGDVTPVAGVDLDFAPMYETAVDTTHRLRITHRDGSAVTLDPDRFTIEQRMGDFPEAVYRYRADPRAAADNVRALRNLKLRAIAEPVNPSAAVPILTLVDIGDARPLPFARHGSDWRASTVQIGENANRFASDWPSQAGKLLLDAHSPAQSALPIKTKPMSGSGAAALSRRKTPPLVAALSEGMDLQSADRGKVSLFERPARAEKARVLELTQASRFAATQKRAVPSSRVTQSRTRAVTDQPELPRMAPPRAMHAFGRLLKLEAAAPQTLAAAAVPVLRRGLAAKRDIQSAADMLLRDGIELAAGAVQLWTIPEGRWRVMLDGDAARVVALARGGRALLDHELAGAHTLALPAKTEALAVWSLGRTAWKGQPEFAAISAREAPEAPVATGWHVNGHVQLVDPCVALARGARVRLARAVRTTRGLESAALAVRDQPTVETTLAAETTAVLVSGAVANPTLADLGDLRLGVTGAQFGAPLLFESGGERAALYPVSATQPFSIAVGSVSGFRLSAVVGLRGRPAELATRLHGTSLGQLVSDGPLSPDGAVRISLRGEST